MNRIYRLPGYSNLHLSYQVLRPDAQLIEFGGSYKIAMAHARNSSVNGIAKLYCFLNDEQMNGNIFKRRIGCAVYRLNRREYAEGIMTKLATLKAIRGSFHNTLEPHTK